MKRLRTILFILVPIMLVLIAPSFLAADSAYQFGPEDYETPVFPPDSPSLNGEIPSIEPGAPYRLSPPPAVSAAPKVDPSAADQLAIDVWYGDTQTFSQLGSPQLWANILGTVTGLDPENPAHSLSYTLNGGSPQPLNIGPDLRRLYEPGEFNIELPVGELNTHPGTNEVVITANAGGVVATKKVTVNRMTAYPTIWPMPYTANWASLGGDIQEGAQIVDGRWSINAENKLTLDSPGYDRLVTLGDYFWEDYEVKVPITVREWNTDEWGSPSNGGGVGLAVRWRGHYKTLTPPDQQPLLGWSRLGALAWYRLEPKTNPPGVASSFEMLGHGGARIASRTDLTMEEDKTYWFKLSVQSSAFPGQPSTYRFKVWEFGMSEPAQWSLSSVGRMGEPPTGSVLLVAHQVIAEFGNVEVTPLPQGPFKINLGAHTNGQIILDPQKTDYSYGEKVVIRAVGNTGYKLSGWTNSLAGSGTQNPIILEVTQTVTVGANFTAASPPPELTVAVVGNGTVTRDASPPYLYGQLVQLTPVPGPGYTFTGWSGDLTGADNPADVVLDDSKNITANFVETSTISPVSDDFNACALDDALWDFINPLGDGAMQINGTELHLSVPAGVAHDVWGVNNSVRLMQPTQDGSFEIEAKLDSVVTTQYQIQGILVEQDATNYLRFDTHHDGNVVRLYVASIVNGVPAEVLKSGPLGSTPSYLRVTRNGNQWTYSYSTDGNTWTAAGSSFNRTMVVAHTGVFAANQAPPVGNTPPPAHTAIVDYFFNSASPISPEDGNQIGDFTIQFDTVGEGTVTVVPSKATYQCNDVVTLTASPAAGWTFTGWSGDLSGTSPQQQIVVEQNYSVVANFTEEQGPPPPPTSPGVFFPVVVGAP